MVPLSSTVNAAIRLILLRAFASWWLIYVFFSNLLGLLTGRRGSVFFHLASTTMKLHFAGVLALVLLLLAAASLRAQDEVLFDQGAEDQFLVGTKQYAQGDFKAAYVSFERIAEQIPRNQRSTAAMIMSAKALLDENPQPSRDEIIHHMDGNICRCTGYVPIVAAIERAAQEMAKETKT